MLTNAFLHHRQHVARLWPWLNVFAFLFLDNVLFVTLLTYTLRGWLESSSYNGALTQYVYFPTGTVKSIKLPNGQAINYQYDGGERLIAIIDSQDNRIDYVRDLMGNVTQTNTKDPNGTLTRVQTSVFNALGQLTKTIGNNGQTNKYVINADGNLISDENALNNTTSKSFDALNRIKKIIDHSAGETSYSYKK